MPIVKNENGSETEIISTHFTQSESDPEPMEPEPENEAGPEKEAEVAGPPVEVKEEKLEEAVSAGVEVSSSTQDKGVENNSQVAELEEDPTYSPESPRDCETSIDGDKLIHQGVAYMFDEDDGCFMI